MNFNVVVEGHRWFFPVVQQWNFCQPTSEFYVVKRLSRDGVNKRHFIVGFVVLYYHRAFTSILDYCHLNGFDLGFFDRDRGGKYPAHNSNITAPSHALFGRNVISTVYPDVCSTTRNVNNDDIAIRIQRLDNAWV
ncbi:hypothetical protein SLS64_014022 [Diaporthe eres]